MKTIRRAALLALAFAAAGSLARAQYCPPVKFDAGINAHFGGHVGGIGCGAQAGPWYTYFPYQAYFQTPAPIGGWPYWPTANASPIGMAAPYGPPPALRPASYDAPAPSYWYGRK